MFVRTLDDFVAHDCLHSLVYGRLESGYVDLLSTEKLKQCLLLLETVGDQITIGISLVHALAELLLVVRATLSHLHEYGLAERLSLANHVSCMLHVLLVSCTLFFARLCSLDLHLLLFILRALVAVLILVGAWDLNEAGALEVLQERYDAGVHVTCWLRQHSLLGLVLFLRFLINGRTTLCCLLGISLGWSFLATSFRLNLLFLILLLDAFALLFQDLLFLFGELLA